MSERPKRVIQVDGRGHPRAMAVVKRDFERRGYRWDGPLPSNGNCARFSHAMVWNGQQPHVRRRVRQLANNGVKIIYVEVGYFPQGKYVILSRKGSVGGALFQGEDMPPLQDGDEETMEAYARDYIPYDREQVEQKGHIAVMLQLERDFAIKTHGGGFRRMQQFVDHIQTLYPDDDLVIKTHPKRRDLRIRTEHEIVRRGSLWEVVLPAKLVVGINSTSLYEAVLAGKPIRPFGRCPLHGDWNHQRAVVREIMRRQIPIAWDEIPDEIYQRSLGYIP